MRSGAIPARSLANHCPVLPNAEITSSAIIKTSWRLQISRSSFQKASDSGYNPDEVAIGSIRIAATVSARSARISFSKSAAVAVGSTKRPIVGRGSKRCFFVRW